MSEGDDSLVLQAGALAIGGRALLLEGAPGAGKSSLALALLDRGAKLIGDDAVTLTRKGTKGAGRLVASPPPNIEGLLEVRGVGLVRFEVAGPTPVALILTLGATAGASRLPEKAPVRAVLGCAVPVLPFEPGFISPAQRAMAALELHGLPLPHDAG